METSKKNTNRSFLLCLLPFVIYVGYCIGLLDGQTVTLDTVSDQLKETQDSILEIAGKYGYENGSKFATAFRSVMGVSPSQYRRRYRWEQENGIAPHMTQVEP